MRNKTLTSLLSGAILYGATLVTPLYASVEGQKYFGWKGQEQGISSSSQLEVCLEGDDDGKLIACPCGSGNHPYEICNC